MIALSTAFQTAQIVVEIGDKKIVRSLDANCKTSEKVLENLAEMIDETGKELKDNDFFAIVVGPGSFTGLRVGLAIVKGLCAGVEKPVLPLSNLGLLAYSYLKRNKIDEFYTAINALSGFYFVCKFNSKGEAVTEEKLVTSEELNALKGKIVCLKGDLPFEEVKIEPDDLYGYAKKMYNPKNFVDYRSLAPVYLRKSQAESALEQKNLKKS